MRFSDRISTGLRRVRSQPSSLQIVHGMMRLRCLFLVGLSAATAASACSRPVLYYPETYPAPKPAPRAVPRTDSSSSAPTLAGAPAGADADYLAARRLVIPVAGADPAKLEDSFKEPRDGDRVHRAIDI